MIIKQLDLVSFGKFKNKSLNLSKGFNIIYGDNEAGKTTIHKFIEGMFFGFFRPYSKRRLYTEDYERYFPWDNTDYRGVLKFIYREEIYRIERNFVKGFDDVKIFDDKIGEEITHLFEYDPISRLYSPSSVLGLNSVVYNNTVNIKQLSSKTDKILAKEIKDSLINIGGSLDEDISVKNALEDLNKKINFIGTAAQRKSSPYGKTVDRLENLYDERKNGLRYIDRIKSEEVQLKDLKDEISFLEKEREDINKNIGYIERLEIKEKYEEALELTNDVHNLSNKLKTLKGYSSFNFDDYTRLISLQKEEDNLKNGIIQWNGELKKTNNSLNELIEDLNFLQKYNIIKKTEFEGLIEDYEQFCNKNEKLKILQNEIENIEAENKIFNEDNMQDLIDDIYIYEELEEKRNAVFHKKEHGNILFLRTRLEEKLKEAKRKKLLISISVLSILTSIVLGVKNTLFFILSVPFVLFLIYSFYSKRETKDYLNDLKMKIDKVSEEERNKDKEIERLEYKMDIIIKKYDCTTKAELKRFLDENYEIGLSSKNKVESFKSLKTEEEILVKEIYEIEDELKYFSELLNIKENFTLEDIKRIEKEYFKYITKKDREEELLDEQKYLMDKINNCHVKLGEITEQVEGIFLENNSNNIEEFKEGLEKKEEYNSLNKDIENKKILLSKILGNNNLEYLRKKSIKTYEDFDYENNILEKDSLINSLDEIENNLSKKQKNITIIEERINGLFTNFRPLVEIDEDILRKEKTKKGYENKLKSIKIARDTIEKISKNIQRDFAPTLNKRVSDIISKVTKEKYKEVKINENMDISVLEPENNILVNIERLSGGTMDQLYFSTRFGIIDILKEEKVPLILDDCFVQYDINRLENILRFLVKESEKRQIFLFTCHRREKEILDRLNAKINYVKL